MNKVKRWYYNLTKKQVEKIIVVVEFFTFIFITISIKINLPRYRVEFNDNFELVSFIFVIYFAGMICSGTFFYEILWNNLHKAIYLWHKEHNEVIVPKVRKKFGLSSEFKEVLYIPKEDTYDVEFKCIVELLESQDIRYFAKEVEDGILVSIRSKDGKELTSNKITNYNYFDLNYKPKN